MSSRPLCPQCIRPLPACLCSCACRIDSAVQLLVLQHPMEEGHAKNTARLLHLCITGSRLEVGETWAAHDLQQWLYAPWVGQPADAQIRPVLLYPPTPVDAQLPLVQPPVLPAAWYGAPELLRLVVIDGTWRKSRKMLYLNPLLQQLPRMAIADAPAGRYVIRKAQAPGQLSSFEAAALALAQLQQWPEHHPASQALARSFEAAMAQHQTLQARGQRLPVQAP